MKKVWVLVVCLILVSVVGWVSYQRGWVEFGSIAPMQVESRYVVEVVPHSETNAEGAESLTREFFQTEFEIIKSEESLVSPPEGKARNIEQMMREVYGVGEKVETKREARPKPVPSHCSVTFLCEPRGARVYIDGKLIQEGRKLVMQSYPVGAKLTCRFELDGYKTLEKSIVVPERRSQVFRESLLPDAKAVE